MRGWGLVLGMAALVACSPVVGGSTPPSDRTTLAVEWQRGFSVLSAEGDLTVEVVVSGDGITETEPVSATLAWGQEELEIELPPGAKQIVGLATDASGEVVAGTNLTLNLVQGQKHAVNLVLRPPKADCACLPQGKGKAKGHDKDKAQGNAWGHYKCLGPCFPTNPPQPEPSPEPSSSAPATPLGTLVANPNPVSGAGYPAALALTVDGDAAALAYAWSATDAYGAPANSFGATQVLNGKVYAVWTAPQVDGTTDFTITVTASDGRTAQTTVTVFGGTQTGHAGGGY